MNMLTEYQRHLLSFVLLLFLVLLPQVGTAQASTETAERRVLLIVSYHPDYPTVFNQIEGVTTALSEAGFKRPELTLDIEFMDSKRFYSESLVYAFYQQLRDKLEKLPPYDLILTADDHATKSAIKRRLALFGNLPLVFFGVNDIPFAIEQGENPMVTGVIEDTSLLETLELADRLAPDQPLILVVGATPSAQAILDEFRKEADEDLMEKLKVLSLKDLSFEALKASLRTFPSGSSLVYVNVLRDKTGTFMSFTDSFRMVDSNFAGRIYHPMLPGIGDGIAIGGIVVSQYEQGRTAGAMAARILKGESPETIPMEQESPNIPLFDYPLIADYGIALSDLPDETRFLNRPPDGIELTPKEIAWLKTNHRVRVAVHDAPPWEINTDPPQGMTVDYFRIIGELAGIDFQFVPTDQPIRHIEDLRNTHQQFDMIPVSKCIDERLNRLTMTDGYLSSPWGIFIRDDVAGIGGIDDLVGRRVAVQRGCVTHRLLERDYPGIELVLEESSKDALRAAATGKADATVGNLAISGYYIRSEGLTNLRVLADTPFGDHRQAMLVRKDWAPLTSIIDKALAIIPESRKADIQKKWMPQQISPSAVEKQMDIPAVVLSVQEKAWLDEHPVIRVLLDPYWAPVEFRDEEGRYHGISMDYLKHLEELLGIRLEIVDATTWSGGLEQFRNKQIDMVSSMVRTEERETFALFSEPYLSMPVNIFASNEVSYISNLDNLKDKRVAVVKGYAIHRWLVRDYPNIHHVPVPTTIDALKMVSTGEVDAYVGNTVVASYYLGKLRLNNVRIAGETPYDYDQTMAVRDDWPIFTSILQKALDAIEQSERDAFFNRWMSIQYEHEFDYTLLWQILAGVTIVFLGFSYWNRRLTIEVGQRKKAEEALAKLASLDGLLRIPNRRTFDDYLDKQWQQGKRDKKPLSLIMIDIDHFKLYNDHYGHQQGDECLIKVAKLIDDCLRRPSDLVARYGGEEFCCVLPDSNSRGALVVAEEIRTIIMEKHIPHAASPVIDHVTLSIGVSTLVPSSEASPEELISIADQALYKAKSEGRNRVISSSR